MKIRSTIKITGENTKYVFYSLLLLWINFYRNTIIYYTLLVSNVYHVLSLFLVLSYICHVLYSCCCDVDTLPLIVSSTELREGKGREGRGGEGRGGEGKERKGKGREAKRSEGKGREGKGREGEYWFVTLSNWTITSTVLMHTFSLRHLSCCFT